MKGLSFAVFDEFGKPADDRVQDHVEERVWPLRHALEVIAVGDSKDPEADAEEELVELGYWTRQAVSEAKMFSTNHGHTFGIIDPDYARIYTKARIIAWQFGYALTMHGSYTRDLDLVMVPWTDHCSPGIIKHVVEKIAQATGTAVNGPPRAKPFGRQAWTLALPGIDDPRWVDLSVVVQSKTGVTP